MAVQVKQDVGVMESPQRVNELRRFMKVFLGRPVVVIGGIIIIVLLIAAAIPRCSGPA